MIHFFQRNLFQLFHRKQRFCPWLWPSGFSGKENPIPFRKELNTISNTKKAFVGFSLPETKKTSTCCLGRVWETPVLTLKQKQWRWLEFPTRLKLQMWTGGRAEDRGRPRFNGNFHLFLFETQKLIFHLQEWQIPLDCNFERRTKLGRWRSFSRMRSHLDRCQLGRDCCPLHCVSTNKSGNKQKQAKKLTKEQKSEN